MKKFLVLFLLSVLFVGAVSAKTKILIITGGQSNTDGRLDGETLPEYLQCANDYCMASCHSPYDAERLGVFYPYYPTSGTVGQPKRWAYDDVTYYYISKALKKTYYVAKTSYGGTSISPDVVSSPSKHSVADAGWATGYGSGYHWSADPAFLSATRIAGTSYTLDDSLYEGQSLLLAWVANIDAVIDSLKADGSKVDIRCILWHQGEGDRNADKQYYENMKQMLAFVRQHLVEKTGEKRYAELPFFCGNIPQSSKQKSRGVNDAFKTLDAEDPNFHLVDISDLTMKSDNVHFNAPSAELFGKRLYNSLVENKVIKGKRITF